MTTERGGAPEPTPDGRRLGGTGPSADHSGSNPSEYDIGARWNRWRFLHPEPVLADKELFALLPAALLMDRNLPARAVRLWGVLYLALYDPRRKRAVGSVDPHQMCANARICPASYRLYFRQLERAGWITARRTIRAAGADQHHVMVRLHLDRTG